MHQFPERGAPGAARRPRQLVDRDFVGGEVPAGVAVGANDGRRRNASPRQRVRPPFEEGPEAAVSPVSLVPLGSGVLGEQAPAARGRVGGQGVRLPGSGGGVSVSGFADAGLQVFVRFGHPVVHRAQPTPVHVVLGRGVHGDQQVAGAGGGDIEGAVQLEHILLFFRLAGLQQFERADSVAEVAGVEFLLRADHPLRPALAPAGSVHQDDDRELQSLRGVHGRKPHAAHIRVEGVHGAVVRVVGLVVESADERAERQAAVGFELPRRLRQPTEVRQHLIRRLPEGEGGFGAVAGEEGLDGVRNRPPVAVAVQLVEETEGLPDRAVGRVRIFRRRAGVLRRRAGGFRRRAGGAGAEAPAALPVEEQLLVGEREQRPAQRRVGMEFVVGVFDGGEGGAHRPDLRAAGVTGNRRQRLGDVALLQRVCVGLGNQPAERAEPPEQETDVARLHRSAGNPPIGDFEAALQQPGHETGHRGGLGPLDLARVPGQVSPVRHRDRRQRGLVSDRTAPRFDRRVLHLARFMVLFLLRLGVRPFEWSGARRFFRRASSAGRPEQGREDAVHELADFGDRAEVRGEPDFRGAAPQQVLLDPQVVPDIRAPEAVDGLFRVADQEEPPRRRNRPAPVAAGRLLGGGQQEQDLGLHRVGVLVFVHQDVGEPGPEFLARARIVPQQVARAEQQVLEVQPARRAFRFLVTGQRLLRVVFRFVAGDSVRRFRFRVSAARRSSVFAQQRAQVFPEERRQVGAGHLPELLEPRHEAVAQSVQIDLHLLPDDLYRQQRERAQQFRGRVPGRRPPAVFLQLQGGERLLHPVVIPPSGLLPDRDVPLEFGGVRHRAVEPVRSLARRLRRQHAVRAGERGEAGPGDRRLVLAEFVLVEQSPHRRLGVARRARPRGVEVPVFEQAERRAPEQADRVGPRVAVPPEEPRHARPGVFQLPPQVGPEERLEERRLFAAAQDLEVRVHPGRERALAEQRAAEGVDRPDRRFLQLAHRLLHPPRLRRPRAPGDFRFEALPDAQAQVAGGALGEGDRGDAGHVRPPRPDEFHHAGDERGGLAGAGGGFHDQRGVEVGGDAPSRRGVRETPFAPPGTGAGRERRRRSGGVRRGGDHGSARTSRTSASARPSGFFRSAYAAGPGPQIDR